MTQRYTSASTVQQIKKNLSAFNCEKVLCLLDIDNTIITTKSDFGKYIDELKRLNKANSQYRAKIDNLICQWRIAREVILTDKSWPEFLKERTAYGLTKMDTGTFSSIESMERWRYKELKTLSVEFTRTSPIDQVEYNEPKTLNICDATFFNGIFYTGNAKKGNIVAAILNRNKYDLVFFADDRKSELADVEKACSKAKTPCLLIHFNMNVQNEISEQSIEEKKAEYMISEFLKLHANSRYEITTDQQ